MEPSEVKLFDWYRLNLASEKGAIEDRPLLQCVEEDFRAMPVHILGSIVTVDMQYLTFADELRRVDFWDHTGEWWDKDKHTRLVSAEPAVKTQVPV